MNGLVWCVGLTTTEADEMSWMQISECLPAELTAKIAKKAPRAMKPEASVTGQRQTAGEAACKSANAEKPRALPTGREMVTAASSLPPRRALPMHAVAISLVVDNSGRRAPLEEEAKRPAGHARAPRGEASNLLRLVTW